LSGLGKTISAQDLKPGEVIGPNNWKKIEGMVVGYYLQRIKEGQTILIGAPPKISLLQDFLKATGNYSGQAKINAQDGLDGYVAGQPFPSVDPQDPKAGLKIMYNFYWRWLGDDAISARVAGKGNSLRRVVIFDNKNEVEADQGLYNLRAMGRLSIPPVPAFPEAKEKEIEYFFMQEFLYPRDSAGTSFLLQRYIDPSKWDDMWIFLPSIRRVRRFPTSQRCATQAPTDLTLDDIQIFNGKVPDFTYKLIGKQRVLLVTDWEGKSFPRRNHGDFFPQDMKWSPTDLWVVEQVSKDKNYCYSKRVFWIEPLTGIAFWYKNYDRKGELWKEQAASLDGLLDQNKYSGINPGIQGSVYVTLRNIQTGRDTLSYVPNGYLYNMGYTPKDFTLSTIQQGIRGAGLLR
jgi:hypothetical protein